MEIIVRKAIEEEKVYMERYPIWECGISEFSWHYDNDETCLLVQGQATVEYDGRCVSFGAGDLLAFPKGMDCVWKISAPVIKHYR